MKAIGALLLSATLAAGFVPAFVRADETPATAPANILQQLNNEEQRLYRRAFSAIVRVHIEQNPANVLPADLRTEFDTWRKTPDAGRGGGRTEGAGSGRRGGGGRGDGGGMPAPAAPGGGPGAGPGGGPGGPGGPGAGPFGGGRGFSQGSGGQSYLVTQFIQQKIAALEKSALPADKLLLESLKSLLNRLSWNRNGFSGDLFGLVLDEHGNTIILTSSLREAHKDPLTVIARDGTEIKAKVIGSNLVGAYSIIKLEELAGAKPLGWSAQPIQEGQKLMGICALGSRESLGAISWPNAPGKVGQSTMPDRFSLDRPDERVSGGVFLFDLNGELAAIGWGSTASTAVRLQHDVKFIIDNAKDIEPRQLGVNYIPVPDATTLPASSPLLPSLKVIGNRPAVIVTSVVPASLADSAGLKQGDLILTINGRPMGQVLQVLADMATRNGTVTLGIVRGAEEKTLQFKLDQ